MTQINKQPKSPKQAAACCGPLDDLLDPLFFKALGDPTRLLLLACLAKCGRPCSVTEIAQCCSVDFSVVSRHLALLQRSALVTAAKQGRTVFYTVHYSALTKKLRSLAAAVESYNPSRPTKRKEVRCAC